MNLNFKQLALIANVITKFWLQLDILGRISIKQDLKISK